MQETGMLFPTKFPLLLKAKQTHQQDDLSSDVRMIEERAFSCVELCFQISSAETSG